MKTAVSFFLSLPLIGFAADPPKGTFKSSQFSEARQAAQTQGKSSDNRWSRKMDAAIVKVTAHKKADEIAPDVKKTGGNQIAAC